jgi:hypothetical protein
MRITTVLFTIALVTCSGLNVRASGHGPVFGGATPTLGKGGWSFDQAWMGRRDRTGDSDQMLRTMIGYGLTEDLQITASLPIELTNTGRMPMGRMTSMMSGNRDLEAIVGWRFHRKALGEGARVESTAYVGATLPLESRRAGINTAPSLYLSAASGYASRAHYFWVGGSHQRSADDSGDRLGAITSYSVVYGYRPPALRLDYPKPDLRFFVEAVGEITSRARHGGMAMDDTGGHILLAGPTTLLLYKQYGISGGMLFPVHQRTNGAQRREQFRFGVNFSYFFWLHGSHQ